MYYRRDVTDAAARRKAKRDKDDASPRLRELVPRLLALHFELSVWKDGAELQAARHVKRFVVDQAPAAFDIDCTDQACREGGHDLTQFVLAELEAGRARFETDNRCRGRAGDADCGRSMRVTAIATYAPAAAKRGSK